MWLVRGGRRSSVCISVQCAHSACQKQCICLRKNSKFYCQLMLQWWKRKWSWNLKIRWKSCWWKNCGGWLARTSMCVKCFSRASTWKNRFCKWSALVAKVRFTTLKAALLPAAAPAHAASFAVGGCTIVLEVTLTHAYVGAARCRGELMPYFYRYEPCVRHLRRRTSNSVKSASTSICKPSISIFVKMWTKQRFCCCWWWQQWAL